MADRISRAEQFTVERGWWCLAFSLISALWTVIVVVQIDRDSVRWATATAWAVWVLGTLIWTFGWPGWWRWTTRDRAIIGDELTREQQRSAAVLAMAVLTVGLGVGCAHLLTDLALPVWWPVATLAGGASAAGARFGWLQVSAG